MSDHSRHDLDELSEHIDGRLQEARRQEVEERLRLCAACRAARESLLWARGQARRLRDVDTPTDLEAALRESLRSAAVSGKEETTQASPTRLARRLRFFALPAAAALVVGLALTLARLGPPPPDSLPEAVADELRRRAAGRLALAVEGGDTARLQAYFAEGRLGFEARVLDLGMMGFALQGGDTSPLAGRPSALMLYRETGTDREVLCRMLREGLAALPPPHTSRQHDGIPFHVYELGEITVVFWPEGPVLCALAGRGEPEAILQLAFAKAMKARRAGVTS